MLKGGGDRRLASIAPSRKPHCTASAASLLDSSPSINSGHSVEVVSQERFLQQLEGMSSPSPFADTGLSERHNVKGDHYTWHQFMHRAPRPTRSKHNAPIVVCLRETIRAYSRGTKVRSTSMSLGGRRTVSESSASANDVKHKFVVTDTQPVPQPVTSALHIGERINKNFNAFLSAVEQVHTKDSKLTPSAENMHTAVSVDTKTSVLNNSCNSSHQMDLSSDVSQPLRNLENVDVIRNDLSHESDEQSEQSDDSSSSRVSSTESDSELFDDTRSSSKTSDVSPHDCPQCLAACYAYTHYYALGSKYFKIEIVEDDENEAKNCVQRPQPDPCTAAFTSTHTGHKHIDVVSLDLTGSDVTFTVEQHSTDSSSDAFCTSRPSCPEFIHNFYCTMFGFVPCLPGYCFVPAFYFTFPMWSVPKASSDDLQSTQHPHSKMYHHSQSLCTFRPSLPPAPQRPWLTLHQPSTTKPVAIFTVMCYNVLCDKYATRQLYGYCPSWALNWQHRKQHIFEEIHQYGADIISLQEVETEQFHSFFLPELRADGYEGIFSPKSRARTMSEAEGKHVDGCAIFYRHSKFNLVSEHLVEFNQLAIEAAKGSHDMINRVMTKDNIGLAALLQTTDAVWENDHLEMRQGARQLLLVATCHIHWDPDCSDVKLIQTMMLMNELKNITEEACALVPNCEATIPLILCGDFNSLPDSGVVEFLTDGRLSTNHKDFKDIVYENSLHKLSVSDNKEVYSHAFHLAQAYTPDVMPYTNYTSDFKGIIDYMFYSQHAMLPLGLLGSFDINWFEQNHIVGCPNPQIPSDHLPLLVEFEMYLSSSNQR